jgi:hypothetical protein
MMKTTIADVASLFLLGILLGLCSPGPAHAQQGATFKLTEHVFNAGGHPANGVVLASPSFRMSLDAIGDAVPMQRLSGPSFRMDASFVAAYPPPGEVLGLRFTAHDTLLWDAERSAGAYNVYREPVSDLSALAYGECRQPGLFTRTASDTEDPPPGTGFFYLVTVENRLGEEGTKGYASDMLERANPEPCP